MNRLMSLQRGRSCANLTPEMPLSDSTAATGLLTSALISRGTTLNANLRHTDLVSAPPPNPAVTIRPGPFFWLTHLYLGVLVLALTQLISIGLSGRAQVLAAAGVVVVFGISGARTELRIGEQEVVIRNPWYTKRIPVLKITRVTPQKVYVVRARSSNCLAFWSEGGREGWPAIATLRYSNDNKYDPSSAVAEHVGRSLGVKVNRWQANPGWRPGAFNRR